ncbi:MAG: phosphomannomutase/phosphoglucomutase [Candidatus Portnoybacteria bacterium CG09_land_8_20_14_0_10_44_13]|uniref:Phosphomannomutase/phosphoglucomutase n=5 Tax=Candidatus Portnoyibacteriota TaxID=1817913 RepID=A0A2H0KPT2_9BACT|nr:MAG: phosphomannomutase/phosphoglucomutase [Candidatus Portnoybacteria bacterium CG11_big_fil_rev_8_21_14_0_20_44_10]PIS16637.1 MAG: phosphomannomutase/phosphoglucomutase [Candidatus Portnoybacteria bacterium CG09_land_8_20_14_0_10_44_13]PIZ72601.1 MAG: phosphomannomutase/phosphoglucomutase [Candidatus Portnoybacteria bacterium CG_4_10_14_0_2_um_filter_44_20]PJA63118.1 MAG: phosphomannomutase/phosphoglucomutase [Candidatus Portnoybacteria bacterium CG_4_9_14_3_um_filter_44_9]
MRGKDDFFLFSCPASCIIYIKAENKPMSINPKIFKTYDVRGIYPAEVNEEAANKIGAAFAIYLSGKTDNVVVGRDARISSPGLFKALVEGITLQGLDVIDIGICTTPMLIFATKKIGGDVGGIMLSASHSPPNINGLKLMGERSIQMMDEEVEPIKQLALAGNFVDVDERGSVIPRNILDEYIQHVLGFCGQIKGLRVVADYGNGVGAVSGREVFNKLNIDYIPMYEELDGSFPNHFPDPHNIENMNELRERVKAEKANLGIFFDGDADRSIMIDETGEIVFADMLVAALAREELKKYPGEKVYYDLRFSKAVKEIIEQSGGVPIMMRVGNPFYKKEMALRGGALAGEFSGHLFFKENYAIDDGLFAAIKTMDLICKLGKRLSELINPLKKYFATEEINMKISDADETLKKVKEHYKDGHSIDLDGVYIEYPDWWFSLRKSNTEPVVRLRLEANNKDLLEEKRGELVRLIGS